MTSSLENFRRNFNGDTVYGSIQEHRSSCKVMLVIVLHVSFYDITKERKQGYLKHYKTCSFFFSFFLFYSLNMY